MSSARVRFALLLAALTAPVACAASPDPACHVGADCASGVCNADGTCGADPTASTSSSGSGGASSSSTGGGGAGGSGGTGGEGAGGSPGCVANKDGLIDRAEVPLGPGLHATFKVAE